MAQQRESHVEGTEKSSPFSPLEFAVIGKRYVDELGKAQVELVGKLQEMNRQWLDRMNTEANLTSEFTSKLTSARSVPEAMTACQDWTSRRLEMIAEDGQHILDDAQKIATTGARLLSNAWQLKRSGIEA